jgi:transcriptional regulator with XRE-family HTH domain
MPASSEKAPYNPLALLRRERPETVAKSPKQPPAETFGQRLARLRAEAGYSQRALASELSISQRMVAYYESQSDYPPTHLFPALTKALGVSADQLLGLAPTKAPARSRDTRLWRRFAQVEKLPADDRKQIAQLLDTFLERHKLKRVAS